MNLKQFLNRYPVFLILFLLVVLFFVLAVLSPVSYGGADDIVHYRFARYSFKHPELLLDHWAKPVFTLLASPFAQPGYWGVKLFNLITGAFTAFILFRIAGLLKIRRAWLIVLLLFFTPVYTTMLMSGMTEILFSAVLVLSAYLFLRKEFVWSAVIISLLPLVRTEGIVIWPFFTLGYLFHRQWKAVPFIFSASLIYSIIGGFYFKDFFWLITKVPYTGTYDIYGHGELLHFVKSNKSIFGNILTILFAAGCISFLAGNPEKPLKRPLYRISKDEITVILMPLLVYYAAHSYVWWKGINSYGLIRVMAGVAPLFVIYSLRGINLVLDNLSLRLLRNASLVILLAMIVLTPFLVYEIPHKLSDKDQVVQEAATWYRSSPYNNQKYYIWESYFYFFLDTDPYDSTKMADGIPDRNHPENHVKPGEIVIWDAHFSAVDGRFPLSAILDNPYYKLIKVFRPAEPFLSGGGTYQICFFERMDSAADYRNQARMDSLSVTIKP